MDYMYFKNDPTKTKLARQLNALTVEAPKLVEWPTLEKYGLTNQLENVTSRVYLDQEFIDEGLGKIYHNEEVIYKEMLVEFLASFEFIQGPKDENFNKRVSIKFRVCEQWAEVSLVDFGILLGLVNRHQDKMKYQAHLDLATIQNPPSYSFIELWNEIGMNEYDSDSCRVSDLKNPLYRMIHMLNAWTILYHTQQEKIKEQHLKGIWYVLHPKDRWHLPLAMAIMFQKAATGKFHTLPCGQFVTTIAKNLGYFADYVKYTCAEVSGVKKTHKFFCNAMILKRLRGNRYRLYKDGECKEEEDQTPQGRHRTQSAGPSASGTNDKITLAKLSHQVEHIGRQNDNIGQYLDDLNRMMANASHQEMATMWSERTQKPIGDDNDNDNDRGEDTTDLMLNG